MKMILAVFLLLVSCAQSPVVTSELPTDGAKNEKLQIENLNQNCDGSIEGTMREGFSSPTTTGDIPCPRAYQTCFGGKWVGAPLFNSCENYTKSCGTTVHGGQESGFLAAVGNPCVRAHRTCVNGNWSGPNVVPSCFEQ